MTAYQVTYYLRGESRETFLVYTPFAVRNLSVTKPAWVSRVGIKKLSKQELVRKEDGKDDSL